MAEKTNRILIGRNDVADFKLLNLYGIDVKIDTGAYTSSFHCHQIERFSKDDEDWVKCSFLDPQHPKYHGKQLSFRIHKIRKVKSSNGAVEERISIKTKISLFSKKFPIELTLTERADMRNPVLLGRKFTSKRFLVDTSKKNLSYNGERINIEI